MYFALRVVKTMSAIVAGRLTAMNPERNAFLGLLELTLACRTSCSKSSNFGRVKDVEWLVLPDGDRMLGGMLWQDRRTRRVGDRRSVFSERATRTSSLAANLQLERSIKPKL